MVFFLIMKARNQIRRSSGRPGDESCAHSGDPVLIGTVLRADPSPGLRDERQIRPQAFPMSAGSGPRPSRIRSQGLRDDRVWDPASERRPGSRAFRMSIRLQNQHPASDKAGSLLRNSLFWFADHV